MTVWICQSFRISKRRIEPAHKLGESWSLRSRNPKRLAEAAFRTPMDKRGESIGAVLSDRTFESYRRNNEAFLKASSVPRYRVWQKQIASRAHLRRKPETNANAAGWTGRAQ
jgi:hypothetical protein